MKRLQWPSNVKLVQAGVEGQVRHFVEVDSQGKRTLLSTEVLKEAVPEITEVGTKEELDSQTTDQASLAASAKEAASAKVEKATNQLPDTGVETDASLVAMGLLGVMSGYGLIARKKKED